MSQALPTIFTSLGTSQGFKLTQNSFQTLTLLKYKQSFNLFLGFFSGSLVPDLGQYALR